MKLVCVSPFFLNPQGVTVEELTDAELVNKLYALWYQNVHHRVYNSSQLGP
jgi:hypothetical protein